MELSANACPGENRGERGVAILEFSFLLPVLVLFFIGLVDLGRAAHSYLILTEVAREGVRLAAALPNLEQGEFVNVNNDASVPNQSMVQQRVSQLVSLHQLGNPEIDSEFTALPVGGVAVDPTDDTVRVRVTVPFNGIFPLFNGLEMSVEATGPFLYKRLKV